MGIADAILDLVSSGTTLKENNLKEIEGGTVLESQAALVASRKSMIGRKGVLETTHEMLERLEAHLRAMGQFTILKDGMQHVGKLICSNWGARMDFDPKHGRLLADVLYDVGMGLEVLSPLCPHFFLEMAGLGNFAKGMAVVAARATRLPIYSSFAKEGIGVGIRLASTMCASMQGKTLLRRAVNDDSYVLKTCF